MLIDKERKNEKSLNGYYDWIENESKEDSIQDLESKNSRKKAINIFDDQNKTDNKNTSCTSKISNNNNFEPNCENSELNYQNYSEIHYIVPKLGNKKEIKDEINDYTQINSNLLRKKRKLFKVNKENEKENNKINSFKKQNKNNIINNNIPNIEYNEISLNEKSIDEKSELLSNYINKNNFTLNEFRNVIYPPQKNIIKDEQIEAFRQVFVSESYNNKEDIEDNENDNDNDNDRRYMTTKYSFKIEKFNIDNYKKNESKEKNEIKNIKNINYISIEDIVNNCDKAEFQRLYDWKIFKDGEDLIDTVNNGLISKNIINILNRKENSMKIKVFSINNMLNIIKTFLINSILFSLNKRYTIKNDKILEIKKIDKTKINTQINKNFNLEYLEKNLISIFSNDDNNEKIFKDISEEYNRNNNQYSDLVEHLKLKIIDCLNIIRYMPINKEINKNILDKFKIKGVDFLIARYNNYIYERKKFDELKKNKKPKMSEKKKKKVEKTMKKIEKLNKNQEYLKKNYIATLLLLIYNFEYAFFVKKERKVKVKKFKVKKVNKKKLFVIEK